MNVGIMQLSCMVKTNTKSVATNGATEKNKSFGDLFKNAISTKESNLAETEAIAMESVDLEKLQDLLGSQSMEDFLNTLGIPHDEGLFMIGDEQAIAVDEMMNLENLMAVLNIEPDELEQTLHQLGVESGENTDIWELMEGVLQQGPEMLQQILAALQGEQKAITQPSELKITPKQAEQLMQFLKLAQVAGKNSDLLQNQATTVEQLDQFLKGMQLTPKEGLPELPRTLKQLNEMLKINVKEVDQHPQKTETTLTGKLPLQNFEQVIQQVVKTVETSESTQSLDDVAMPSTMPNTNITARTITVTLPAEKGAQSEALAREIQNLLNRSQISTAPGMTKLLLKLYPENLGSIRIEIMQQDGVLTARFLTSTALGKELLDNQLHQLKSAFAQANIQMDRIDIAQSLQETDRNQRDQQSFGQQFKQQSGQKEKDHHSKDEEETTSFVDYLINEEV
ncbi:flagellar hook-length control protein FliK [Lysinibacillus yapensis]|uniref:Flagellar hook-length control protein FliK n=1 Tax=Ureibacillus yapensis TaxID=2304605 RepID=A0A396SD87_9BACL|nr:flagellar hook-length control protein FliK [Lysinibacillus yapensis]RHW39643.1 flagellar hook-length control protein FliK [Lysinibacillus yapensis]